MRRSYLNWLIGTAVAVFAVIASRREGLYADFNLHYFAGALERQGTYTDTDSLFSMMAQGGVPVPQEGIYGTPTLIALVFQPLSYLPLGAAQLLWSVLCAAALVMAAWWAFPKRRWPLWLALFAITPASFLGLRLGNFSTITTVLLLVAFGCAVRDHKRGLGIALAVATMFKLFPGLLFLVLLYKRQWTAMLWSFITGVSMLVVTVAALGLDDAKKAFEVLFGLGSYVHPSFDNVSIPAFALHTVDNPDLARVLGAVMLVFVVVVLGLLRKLPIHILFASGAGFVLLSQSIIWRHYTPVLILCLVCLFQLTKEKFSLGLGLLSYGFATGWVAFLIEGNTPVTYFTSLTYTLGLVALLALLLQAAIRAQRLKAVDPGLDLSSLENR